MSEKINLPKSSFCSWDSGRSAVTQTDKNAYSTKNEVNTGKEVQFINCKIGDCFNQYEEYILNSKWDVREGASASSVILARYHMFYTIETEHEAQINDVIKRNDNETKAIIKTFINSGDIFGLIDNATEMAYQLGLSYLYDSGTTAGFVADNLDTIENINYDQSLHNTANRIETRRFSENHFVISGYNLIYNEFMVNDDVINSITNNNTKAIFLSDKDIITILPISNDSGVYGETVREKFFEIDGIEHLEKNKSGVDEDIHRRIEAMTNMLISELEFSYQGKIMSKYIPDLQIGDTITLIDDVKSMSGKFRVDTFEHIFDSRGLLTVVNIKACFDLVDPTLDDYSNEISIQLLNDLEKEIVSKSLDGNVIIKNIYGYYAKVLFQNPKYCSIFHKKGRSFFDEAYPVAYNNSLVNPMTIRFYPAITKGRAQIPESIKSAFFTTEHSPLKNIFSRIYHRMKDHKYNFTTATKDWVVDVARYIGDFLISIPTFNLHELFKAGLGMNVQKARDTIFSESNVTEEQSEIFTADTDYHKRWGVGADGDLTIGFFNIQAQKVSNLTPEIANEKNEAYIKQDERLEWRLREKEETIGKIVKDSFDITLCVELYDGFKFNNGYTHHNLLRRITPKGFSNESKNIYKNNYGFEHGAIISNDNVSKKLGLKIKNASIKFLENGNPKNENEYEPSRHYIETTIDISEFKYPLKDGKKSGEIFKTLKIIWFHNLFGSKADDLATRKQNIRSVLDKYNKEVDKDVAVVIMGDFNLEVVNFGKKPTDSSAGNTNAVFYLQKSDKFINRIKRPTTLNKAGQPKGNIYDNVLICTPLEDATKEDMLITINRFVYPYGEKKRISDHLPVFISLKKAEA